MLRAIRNNKILVLFIILSSIYILEALLIPPSDKALSKYKLSETEAKFLGLTVTLPMVFIWMMGGYVSARFRSYANSIAQYKDGRAFRQLSYGLLAICLWLPVNSTLSNLTTYLYRNHPSWTAPLVIINNYLNLAFVLVGFVLIYKGARALTKLKESKKPSGWKYLMFVPLIAISELFIFLSLNNPVRQFPSPEVPVAAYYLPDWLLVGTIIIPYIAVFSTGLFAIVDLYTYRTKVRGVIYRDALDSLAKGLLCIIASIIFIRYLTSLTTLFNTATLKLVLLILYLLVLVLLGGFILLVKSVKKLQDIEKV